MGAGTSNPRYVGQQGLAAYNAITSGTATGVPVENTGGSGTRDAHWRESVFGNELMTGFVGPGTNMPLSRLTVGSLADLGYSVNFAAADPYTLPAASSTLIVAETSSPVSSATTFAASRQDVAAAQYSDPSSPEPVLWTNAEREAPLDIILALSSSSWESAVDVLFADEGIG